MSGYIKLGDIKGESAEPDHKEWINLLSVSQGVSKQMPTGASGSTRQRGAARLGDVVIVKELDKSTPSIIEAICKGTNFKEVLIHLTTSAEGERRTPYMVWTLTNAMVTDYSVSGATEGGTVPTESLSINYEEVKWTYDQLDKQNKSQGKVETSWKTEEGGA